MNEEKKEKRELVVPGEIIVSGEEYLPGDYTRRKGNDILSMRFGLAEKDEKIIKVIPLAGVYMPRRGNVVVGKVIDITFNGWIIDINAPYLAFLPVIECNKFLNKEDITEYLDIGDMVVAKVLRVKHRGVDLTLKMKSLGKLDAGIVISVNSNKVPRIIGKEGSMINLIKHSTSCNIVVGQNGIIWIEGKDIESELFAKEAILFIIKRSFVEGLTDQVQKFLENTPK